jgi:hypothetical protein
VLGFISFLLFSFECATKCVNHVLHVRTRQSGTQFLRQGKYALEGQFSSRTRQLIEEAPRIVELRLRPYLVI